MTATADSKLSFLNVIIILMENIFESHEWEEFKLATGYSKSFRIEDILVLSKKLPLGQSILYSPMVQANQKPSSNFFEELKKIAKSENAIFYRLELDIEKTESAAPIPRAFIKSFEEMQPEHTLVLDLTKSEDEILAQMKQKGRYNIRVAEREQLVISKSETRGKELDDFYKLYSDTGKRHHITYRAKSYFENLLDIVGKNGYICVYTVYLNPPAGGENGEIPLASAIIVYSGTKAIYMFGASSDEYKNIMAPYKLHWEIIKGAKQKRFEIYDFFGIAPDDDPKHAWAGVTRFKRQFGGRQVDILGSYDLPFSPIRYKLFKIAEKIRR